MIKNQNSGRPFPNLRIVWVLIPSDLRFPWASRHWLLLLPAISDQHLQLYTGSGARDCGPDGDRPNLVRDNAGDIAVPVFGKAIAPPHNPDLVLLPFGPGDGALCD